MTDVESLIPLSIFTARKLRFAFDPHFLRVKLPFQTKILNQSFPIYTLFIEKKKNVSQNMLHFTFMQQNS